MCLGERKREREKREEGTERDPHLALSSGNRRRKKERGSFKTKQADSEIEREREKYRKDEREGEREKGKEPPKKETSKPFVHS